MKSISWLGVLWLGLCLAGGIRSAALGAPWEKLLTFNRLEADPNKEYRLEENDGPWMILACSFSGENARQQAHDLAIELRKRYKLPAYVYEKEFHLGQQAPGRGTNGRGETVRMRYQRGSEFNEIAVMVGNYPSIDDPEAQATLERMKFYQPECLKLTESKPTARNLAAWRMFTKFASAEKEKEGPMRKAFLTTNPLLPKDFFAPSGVDPFVLKMNEGNQYSLLDCPGKYTVQVAHFTGRVVTDQAEIQDINAGRRGLQEKLERAGEEAERLTEALRVKGYEAYVFHDRYASLVTVGSFNSVGTPRPDGRTEINPKIHAIMKTFGAEAAPAAGQGAIKPKTLVGIPFDAQAIPVKVPKRSISSDYARRMANR